MLKQQRFVRNDGMVEANFALKCVWAELDRLKELLEASEQVVEPVFEAPLAVSCAEGLDIYTCEDKDVIVEYASKLEKPLVLDKRKTLENMKLELEQHMQTIEKQDPVVEEKEL